MQRHFIIVVGLPQINGLDDFGLLFDIGAFCTWGWTVKSRIYMWNETRNNLSSYRINVALFMSSADWLLFRLRAIPKEKEMKEHGQSRRIFDDPGIYTFLIGPCLSFGKSLAEKGVELQRHYFFILFSRCESHSILDSLGVDFLFLFSVFMSCFFIFYFFFSPFLCSIFNSATRHYFS